MKAAREDLELDLPRTLKREVGLPERTQPLARPFFAALA
jgi:hypothetical protein